MIQIVLAKSWQDLFHLSSWKDVSGEEESDIATDHHFAKIVDTPQSQ